MAKVVKNNMSAMADAFAAFENAEIVMAANKIDRARAARKRNEAEQLAAYRRRCSLAARKAREEKFAADTAEYAFGDCAVTQEAVDAFIEATIAENNRRARVMAYELMNTAINGVKRDSERYRRAVKIAARRVTLKVRSEAKRAAEVLRTMYDGIAASLRGTISKVSSALNVDESDASASLNFDLQLFAAEGGVNMVEQRRFTKEKIRNELDRNLVWMQEIAFTGADIEKCTAIGKKTSYGMNELTREFMKTVSPSVYYVNGEKKGVFNNTVSAHPFIEDMVKIDVSGLFDKNIAEMIVDSVKMGSMEIQFTEAGDIRVWMPCYVKRVNGKYALNEYLVFTVGVPGKVNLKVNDNADDIAEMRNEASAWKRYGFVYAGPSNQRQVNILAFRRGLEEGPVQFAKRMWNMFDSATGGLLTSIKEMVGNKKGGLPFETVFKLVSRISLMFTPSTRAFETTGFYYLHGSFGVNADTAIKAKVACADGQFFYAVEGLAEKFGVSAESCFGLCPQFRIRGGIIGKGMGIGVYQSDIETIVNNCYSNQISITWDEFISMGRAGAFIEGVTYEVNGGGALFLDENTMKAVTIVPENGVIEANIADVFDATGAKMNNQDAIHAIHLPGMEDYLLKLGKNYIDEQVSAIMDMKGGKDNNLVNPFSFYVQSVSDVVPQYAFQNRTIMESLIKNSAQGTLKTIDKMNFPVAGEYRRFICDVLYMAAGVRCLADGHVHIRAKKAGTKEDITRNPRTASTEHYIAVCDSIVTTKNEINRKFSVPDEIKDIMCRLVENLDEAVIMTPADPKFANRTGGSDNDGDGGTAHEDEEYIDITAKEPAGTNEIPKAPKTGKKVNCFNIGTVQDMMIDGLFGQADNNGKRSFPDGVGILTNHSINVVGLANLSDEKLQEVIDCVIVPNASAMGFKPTINKYTRLYTGTDEVIGNDEVIKAALSFYKSDMSVESLRAHIEDCKKMFPSVIGRGIDVNKTGENVATGYLGVIAAKDINGNPINRKNLMRVKSEDTLHYETFFLGADEFGKQEGYEHDVQIELVCELNKPEKKNTVYVTGVLSGIRLKLVNYAVKKYNKLFAMAAKLDYMTDAERGAIVRGSARQYYDVSNIKQLSTLHSLVVGNKGLQSDDKKIIRRHLANTIRMVIGSDKGYHRYLTLLDVASDGGKKKPNSFIRCLEEEYMLGIVHFSEEIGYSINGTVGVRAYARCTISSMVDTMEFKDGLSADGSVVTDKHVNGIWHVEKIDGKLCVTRSVKEHYAVPAVNTDVVIQLSAYDPSKPESQYNCNPAVEKLTKYDFVRLEAGKHRYSNSFRRAVILSDNYEDAYGMMCDGNTRMSALFHRAGVSELSAHQLLGWPDERTGAYKLHTIICGRYVDCRTKDLPMSRGKKVGVKVTTEAPTL